MLVWVGYWECLGSARDDRTLGYMVELAALNASCAWEVFCLRGLLTWRRWIHDTPCCVCPLIGRIYFRRLRVVTLRVSVRYSRAGISFYSKKMLLLEIPRRDLLCRRIVAHILCSFHSAHTKSLDIKDAAE